MTLYCVMDSLLDGFAMQIDFNHSATIFRAKGDLEGDDIEVVAKPLRPALWVLRIRITKPLQA